MEASVRNFNRLPRPASIGRKSDLPNHWIISIRHAALNPPGDIVIAFNRHACHVLLYSGRARINTLQATSEQAEDVVKVLLDLFIRGQATLFTPFTLSGVASNAHLDLSPFAPVAWAMQRPELAAAIEVVLRRHGVCEELCSVGVCGQDDVKTLGNIDLLWGVPDGLHAMVVKSAGGPDLGYSTWCHGCGGSAAWFKEYYFKQDQLYACAGCKMVYYHSKACQEQHWPAHKPVCLENRPVSVHPDMSDAPPGAIDHFEYYNNVARKAPELGDLFRSLNMCRGICGPGKPMRRLMMTAQDTPENMRLLWGPDWKVQLEGQHRRARLELLLDPPRGSPLHAYYRELDHGAPACSPRPANEYEQSRIALMRQIQELVRHKVGEGFPLPDSNSEIEALLSTPGAIVCKDIPDTGYWLQWVRFYTVAVNAMDQGGDPERKQRVVFLEADIAFSPQGVPTLSMKKTPCELWQEFK